MSNEQDVEISCWECFSVNKANDFPGNQIVKKKTQFKCLEDSTF